MRVVVLGAGLLGVTSAYYLQQLGHEVTVVDRHATPAARARGRAALQPSSPTASQPAELTGHTGGLLQRLRAVARRRLGKLMDRAVGAPRRLDPVEQMVRLAAYSRRSVRALSDEAGMADGARTGGLLNIYTDADAMQFRKARDTRLRALGCEERVLTAEEAIGMEPSLEALQCTLAGATFTTEDPDRDPSQFAASMVFMCRAAGVRFLTRHTVVSLQERGGRIDHVELRGPDGRTAYVRGQAYVMALGASSVPHAEALGIDMPLRFVREYVVMLPIKDIARAPRVAVRDRQGKLRIARVETPLGERLRVSGITRDDAGDRDDRDGGDADSDRFDAILHRVETLFPGAADLTQPCFETAVHAVSATGLPLIGKSPLPNLFLNTAAGARGWGWVHACGAGKSIARIVSGLRPELEFAFTGL